MGSLGEEEVPATKDSHLGDILILPLTRGPEIRNKKESAQARDTDTLVVRRAL